VNLIIKVSEIKPEERVLEIGTGKGVLTWELCKLSAHVEAFELDEANFQATKGLGAKGLRLHLGDAFSARPDFDVLVSSLPYSESSKFVEWLSQKDYSRAVVILQKDFVDKLVAVPREERYRAVSVISQISSVIAVVKEIGVDSFSPPPKVMSVIVEIRPRSRLSQRQIRLIKLLFSQKRRKLSVALKKLNLEFRSIKPELISRRVQELSPFQIEGLLGLIEENL